MARENEQVQPSSGRVIDLMVALKQSLAGQDPTGDPAANTPELDASVHRQRLITEAIETAERLNTSKPSMGGTAKLLLSLGGLLQQDMDTVREQVREAALRALFDELTEKLPTSSLQAGLYVQSALVWYHDRLRAKHRAMAAWADCDKLGGSVRVKCTEDYRGQGMSQTAADKAASDHPVYMEHKERLAQLALAKAKAEDEAALALQALEVAKLFMESYLLVQVDTAAD